MMGNRGGRFHSTSATLGKRRWASHHWICCELSYKGLQHEPMGTGYTSLFFLDEVTALAAGHRPCFVCRRAEAKAFLGPRKADEFDRLLHRERSLTLTLRCPAADGASKGLPQENLPDGASRRTSFAPQHEEFGKLPDGVMLDIDGKAYAVRGSKLLEWTFAGYTSRRQSPGTSGRLLTPPSIAAILAKGYKPRWHESALTGDEE